MDHASSLFAGINLGLSEVSGVCVDFQRQVIASAAVDFGNEPNSRREPLTWWLAVQEVIARLLRQVDADAIVSIAVAGTSGTTVAVDDAGNPLSHALLYNDRCQDRELIKRIAACAPETSAVHGARSGLARAVTLSSAFAHANIMYEADWITFKLSGLLGISDENNALRTGYDPVSRQWPDWLTHTGIRPHALPHVLPAGQLIGPIKTEVARKIQLNTRTLVVSGTIDTCASFISTGAAAPGDGVTSLGNRLSIRLLCENPVYAPDYGIYSHRIGDHWLTGGGLYNAQRTQNKHFTANEIEVLCNRFAAAESMSLDYYSLTDSDILARTRSTGSTDELPSRSVNTVNVLQGALQTMADIEAVAYRRLWELGADQVNTIRTTGKGAVNELWTAARSNTMLARFYPTTSEQPAVGAAMLAKNAVTVSPALA